MRGFDGVELMYATGSLVDDTTRNEVQRSGNVIAVISPPDQVPLDDYAPDYLLKLHPSVFPWRKGARPKGISDIVYYRILLARVPVIQFGQNPGLSFDMFNLWQRHTVNLQSRIRVRCSPELVNQISDASMDDMNAAVQVRLMGCYVVLLMTLTFGFVCRLSANVHQWCGPYGLPYLPVPRLYAGR